MQEEKLRLLFKGATPRLNRFGNHTKKCGCVECLEKRLTEFKDKFAVVIAGGARPKNINQTIAVRPHFRTNPKHLKNDPELRRIVRKMVVEMLTQMRVVK